MKVTRKEAPPDFNPFTLQLTFERPHDVVALWAALLNPGAHQSALDRSSRHFPVIHDLLASCEDSQMYVHQLHCALSQAMREQGFFRDPAED